MTSLMQQYDRDDHGGGGYGGVGHGGYGGGYGHMIDPYSILALASLVCALTFLIWWCLQETGRCSKRRRRRRRSDDDQDDVERWEVAVEEATMSVLAFLENGHTSWTG
ncbi:hypothetical protein Pcinc_021982 [Petrolisthes cinctipes]|uniref:Uncharacterized protein n=1 Tax=Petrolisthes cinctipes TaxID=88211 RepID=A0AAE1FIS9_PETCI|nr:hypothetical protein Pcinc_021982 [Petrolisthes cinctipes]